MTPPRDWTAADDVRAALAASPVEARIHGAAAVAALLHSPNPLRALRAVTKLRALLARDGG